MVIEGSYLYYSLRQYALSEATKAYKSINMSVSGGSGGGSLPTEEIVARAQAYYDFLKGPEQNG